MEKKILHSWLSRIEDTLWHCFVLRLGFGQFQQLPKLHMLVLTVLVSGELLC